MFHQVDCARQKIDDSFLVEARQLGENASNVVMPSNSQGSSNILILEQPASLVRFRYASEGLHPTPGACSTPMKKTFPTIQIVNFDKLATVIVSCVTKDQPYRPHPHCLAGDDCKWGIYQKQVHSNTISFQKLSVQFTKRKQIEEVMHIRQQKNIDPFQTGFGHCKQLDLDSIDLDAIRLCFQVFTLTRKRSEIIVDKQWKQLGVVVSEPIYNKKACLNLKILKLSDSSALVEGGKEILMFCEKVVKDDIEIRFFEQKDQTKPVEWEAFAQFHPSDVHKGCGIAFRSPPYKTLDVEVPVDVFIQLRRPSDNTVGDAVPFQFRPSESLSFKQKRRKYAVDSHSYQRLQNIIRSTPTSQMCSGSETDYHCSNNSVSQQHQSELSYSNYCGPVFQQSNLIQLNSPMEDQAIGLSLDSFAQIKSTHCFNDVTGMIQPSMDMDSTSARSARFQVHYPDLSLSNMTSTSTVETQVECFPVMSRDWRESNEVAEPLSEKLPASSTHHASFNVGELSDEQTIQTGVGIVQNATYNDIQESKGENLDQYSVIDNLSGLLEDLKY